MLVFEFLWKNGPAPITPSPGGTCEAWYDIATLSRACLSDHWADPGLGEVVHEPPLLHGRRAL